MSIFEDHYSHIAESYSVDSKGKAVFYSGEGNHNRVLAYAKKNGAVPIDRTPAGRKLDGIYKKARRHFGSELRGSTAADNVMNKASARYAQNARGHVKTFVCGARPNRTFRQVELPIIVKNSKIKSINGIPRRAFEKAYAKNADRAFRGICLAELRQDRREARRTGDKKQLADVSGRWKAYKIAFPKEKVQSLSKAKETRLNKSELPKEKPIQNRNANDQQIKGHYGKSTDLQGRGAKALKDKPKIRSNQREHRKDSPLAKDKLSSRSSDRQASRSNESQPSKKQGTKEKMTSLRNQSRDRRQSKEQTLKKSGDNKATHPNNTKENLKPLSNKTKDIQGNNKALNEKSKIATNQRDRSFAKDKILSNRRSDRQGGKLTESQALKKHGAKEKMAAVRGQSREKYQKRNQSLKQSGDQKVKQPKNTSDNVKARYGKSSESSQNKASSSNRETTKSASSSRSDSKPKSTQEKQPKPSGDSKPSGSAPRDGGNRRR